LERDRVSRAQDFGIPNEMAGKDPATLARKSSSSLLKKPKLTASMILGTPHRDDVYSAARCTRCRPGDDAVMS
jgi:hypothetical protein